MNHQLPPHFHKTDRISEGDLVPNGQVLTALPVNAAEGSRVIVQSGSSLLFYQYILGSWRLLAMSSGNQYASPAYDNGNVSGTATIDWDNGNVQYATLTADTTFTFANPLDDGRYLLHLYGAFTPTFPADARFLGASTPSPTAASGKKDIYAITYCSKDALYDVIQSPNFAIT